MLSPDEVRFLLSPEENQELLLFDCFGVVLYNFACKWP